MQHDVKVTPAEIRAAWATIQGGRNPFHKRQLTGWATDRQLTRYRGTEASSFVGASGAQIQDRLDNGYYVEGKEFDVPGGDVEIVSPMMDLVEEDGDLIVSAAIAGDDLYRVRWEDFEAKKGLRIRVQIGMSAGTNSDVLSRYMTWVLKVIDAAERRGIAPDVELYCGAGDCFTDGPGGQTVTIPLVKAGEIIDAVAWRAFMAPGAFRSLGFVALVLAADKIGRPIASHLGKPMGAGWKVTHGEDTLEIDAPKSGTSFPEDVMDAQLEAAYAGA